VTGTVGATQSGPWTVSVSGALPPVSVPNTAVINDVVVPPGSIDKGFFFDASMYKEIRIVAVQQGCGLGSGSAFTVTVWLLDETDDALMRLDQYPVSTSLETTNTYDVVARRMAYTVKNESCATRLIAYGRAN